ncbi:MAG TPA: beta-L-arabinofuranosidase domain-containing protein [Candidatus Limnocylindrales bacterium]|nr:beta-L-arabinofuranosidase domain-containing protein [Candidatus Limnocylindrales bacterium]
MTGTAATATTVAAVVPTAGAPSALRPVSARDVTVTGGFWAERAATNRERTIPAGFRQLTDAGTLENFRLAASAARDGYRALGIMFDKPFPFLDSDVYKWLEGAGWELGRSPDPAIRAMADEAIGLVEAAQRPDGYLNTFVQVLAPGTEYEDLQWGHELYCIGHLIQAAISWHRALGDDRLLLVAERAAASVERALGPNGREMIDGHPEIEMALVELYRATGKRRHLDLAAAFIERRGHGLLGAGRFGRGYWQDHLPVREAPSATGHAVRHLYLDSGAVDVAVETGDSGLLDAVHRRWRDMVESKMYLTGALGSRHKDEAFGDPFELPPDLAYAETCAAIASVMLAWRLLLATGDPACADVIERTTYNGVLSSLSMDGDAFFYVNPLQRRTHRAWSERGDGERRAWYACACCPPNLMRLVGSWHQMLATTDDGGVQLQQYASAEVAAGGLRLAVETDYPWSGSVRVTVVDAPERPVSLSLRVPGWCEAATLRNATGEVGRRSGDGRAIVETRRWQPGAILDLELSMPARITQPDPRVDAVRGCVALERGPLVYALETADLPPGIELEQVTVRADGAPSTAPRQDLAPAIVGLATEGRADGAPVDVRAIPYFAWANRTAEGMRVWIPRDAS